MHLKSFAILCLSCCTVASAQQPNASCWSDSKPKFVVVGDSLSAGVQNFSLLDKQQLHGYAKVISDQANWGLTLPLVPYPGAPNVLQLVSAGPPAVVAAVGGPLPAPRDNPDEQATDVSVPGVTVGSALTLRPDPNSQIPTQLWATLVLGFPYLSRGCAPTEVELATAMKPEIVLEWLGNNDALIPALIGQINALTPVTTFAQDYERIVSTLSKTGAKLVTATIPDVTEVPYFTSVKTIAAQKGRSAEDVADALGIGINDYLRPSALKGADDILTGKSTGKLPTTCDVPFADIPAPNVPCVLTEADAQTIRSFVNCYNLIIVATTYLHGGVVADIHGLVDRVYSRGYKIKGRTITTNFLGGLFSLDGMHPSNTGYAIVANEFIKTMNPFLHAKIPLADIDDVFQKDPLAGDVLTAPQEKRAPGSPGAFCFNLGGLFQASK